MLTFRKYILFIKIFSFLFLFLETDYLIIRATNVVENQEQKQKEQENL